MPKKKVKSVKKKPLPKKRKDKKLIKNKPEKIIKNKSQKAKSKDSLIIKKTTTYSPEDKVEIKKIKKQPNEKRAYNVKDFVVYPKHGVGKNNSCRKSYDRTN